MLVRIALILNRRGKTDEAGMRISLIDNKRIEAIKSCHNDQGIRLQRGFLTSQKLLDVVVDWEQIAIVDKVRV